MKVTTELRDYSNPTMPVIKIHDHWNNRNMVEIEVEGKRYTVLADEVKRAVDNATNFAWGE